MSFNEIRSVELAVLWKQVWRQARKENDGVELINKTPHDIFILNEDGQT